MELVCRLSPTLVFLGPERKNFYEGLDGPRSGVPLIHSQARCAYHPTALKISVSSKWGLSVIPFQETVGVTTIRSVLLEECLECSYCHRENISGADLDVESSGAQKWSKRCPRSKALTEE